MRKVNVTIEGEVMFPVKVKLDVLIRADDDANFNTVINKFAKGEWKQAKADVEEVEVQSCSVETPNDLELEFAHDFQDMIEAQINEYCPPIKISKSKVTDSR